MPQIHVLEGSSGSALKFTQVGRHQREENSKAPVCMRLAFPGPQAGSLRAK